MNIIKLNAIDSTNSYLLRLIKEVKVEDPTIVVTDEQTNGRGQRGTNWVSSSEKSITFSIFSRFKGLPLKHQCCISYAVSLGISKVLVSYKIPEVTIKWPNDIMSHFKKLAGILIENQSKKSNINSSIIGVGVNVNDENLEHLPNATSLYMCLRQKIPQKELMMKMITSILLELDRLEKRDYNDLKMEYEQSLFQKDKISVFKEPFGKPFNGLIKGVSDLGELKIELDDGELRTYRMKEIEYLFQT